MKVKILAVLLIVSSVFIGAVLWRTDTFVYGDRMNWVEAQNRTQLGAMSHAMESELKSLQRIVSTFNTENFKKEHFNWSAVSPYFAAASFAVQEHGLEPQTFIAKDNSKAANWTKEFLKSAIGGLKDHTADMRFFIKPFQDSNKGRYVGILFIEGAKAYALFGGGEIFQSLIDSQRGSLSTFSVVTSEGLTVGHSIPEYLGTVMSDDPFYKEAQKSASNHGSGTYKLPNGQELYGMFETIPHSNLLMIGSAPVNETMKGRQSIWWQFLLLGCGLVLVGSASVVLVVSPAEKKIENLEEQLLNAKKTVLNSSLPEKTVSMDAKAAQKDVVAASMRVASALAHESRGPLTSILGYCQMILAKNPTPEIIENTESILRETRAVRVVLDKMLDYAGEKVKEKNMMRIEGPLSRALKHLEPLFQTKGVRVVKKIESVSNINLNVDALTKAFENILTNSVEAMERMSRKEISITLTENEGAIHLLIEDNGEGIESQNLQKIFDPFFTTRSFQNHMGLGLSATFGVLKEHHAEINISSERGKGTQVAIEFAKLAAGPMAATGSTASILTSKEENAMEKINISKELPQMKSSTEDLEDSIEESGFSVESVKSFPQVKFSNAAEFDESAVNFNSNSKITPDQIVKQAQAEAQLYKSTLLAKKTQDVSPDSSPILTEAESASPLDMNIETLLDLPAIHDRAMGKPQESLANSGSEKGNALQAETQLSNSKMANLQPVQQSLQQAVDAPPAKPKGKSSKLDSYHVDIRKPGKRI